MHGAQVIMVRGNFDDCLRMAREMAWHYPVALVNSVNPVRLEGQKTAAFEIVDFLGDAPDYHLLPVGNAGNISAYWLGYRQYHELGRATKLPVMRGFQAEGAAPAGDRRAVPRPRDQGHRDPDRQPRLVEARRGGARRVRWPLRGRLRRADPGRAEAARLPRRRLRRAGVGGGHRRAARRTSAAASRTSARRSSSPSPATGSRTPPRHWRDSAPSSTSWSTPTSRRRPRPPGSSGSRRELRRRAGAGAGAGHVGQPGPGLRLAGPGARAVRRADRRPRPATAWSSRSRAKAPARSCSTRATWSCGRCGRGSRRWASRRPASGCTAATSIPHARGLGSSSAAIVGGLGLARALVPSGSSSLPDADLVSLAADLEGHPDNVAPAALGGFVVCGREDDRWYAVPAPVDARVRRSSSCRRTPCRPSSPAGCCPTRCRTPTRRPTPVVRRCWWPRWEVRPSTCWPRPATTCTSSTAARRCPTRSRSSTRCGPTGHRRSSRGQDRPCSRSSRTAYRAACGGRRSSLGVPSGWTAHDLGLDRCGVRHGA